jgi:3-methyladenine DNA glycosylase AlkD
MPNGARDPTDRPASHAAIRPSTKEGPWSECSPGRAAGPAAAGPARVACDASGMSSCPNSGPRAAALADEIDRRIRALPDRRTEAVRGLRREYSNALRGAAGEQVLAVAQLLVARQRWVAYELLYHHPRGIAVLDVAQVERLGRGIDHWTAVDPFGRYVSGPAWQRGRIADAAVHRWTESADRWWRRAALVSTVPLNLRSAGGTGDAERTLAVCRRLAADRDDAVVKALSWALRELVHWEPEAVRGFLSAHDDSLPARVKREVGNKLETGLKNPRAA